MIRKEHGSITSRSFRKTRQTDQPTDDGQTGLLGKFTSINRFMAASVRRGAGIEVLTTACRQFSIIAKNFWPVFAQHNTNIVTRYRQFIKNSGGCHRNTILWISEYLLSTRNRLTVLGCSK